MLEIKKIRLFILVAMFISQYLYADKLEKLQPTMKPVDRDWAYFEALSCDDVKNFVAHSDVEKRLLAKRKGQCNDKYKAFYSSPLGLNR